MIVAMSGNDIQLAYLKGLATGECLSIALLWGMGEILNENKKEKWRLLGCYTV
jgi:hypothetical protein